ncbi:MAG: histidine-type phosphatase, partial [Sphingomonas sp.]
MPQPFAGNTRSRTSAAQAWPSWPVKPGYLTPHGAEALRRLAAHDRAALVRDRVLPAMGCGTVRI